MTRRIDKLDTAADVELRKCLDAKTSFVMVAGAGSGKTTSLVKALDYLGKTQGELLRRLGQRIACITYTTVAENEIWNDVGHDSLFHVSTIHSFLWELIKPFQTEIKNWVTQRIQEKLRELNEQKQSFNNKHKPSTKNKNQKDIERYQELRDKIVDVPQFTYGMGSNYIEGILGHDDIIKIAPTLIKACPLLRTIFAQKYPFLFIDESQDTIPEIVEAAKAIVTHPDNKFCLGFFGDEMQKIYLTGIGKIGLEQGWKKITKPENFRCPISILNVINNIRKSVDGLEQIGGKKGEQGNARLFLFSSNVKRDDALNKVRQYVAKADNDPLWLSNEKKTDVTILVIEHRMAANRLGFSDLYTAFKDSAPASISEDFTEGRAWALKPFQCYLLPLVEALEAGKSFEVLELLRQYCPLLKKDNLKAARCPAEILQSLKDSIQKLSSLMAKSSASTVLDVLNFVHDNNLIKLDERIFQRMQRDTPLSLSDDIREDSDAIEKVMHAYFQCPVEQLWGYQTYINDESPFSTQHSIKGAEFDRVLVVLDDDEGKRSTLYSYDKLLGGKSLSDTDRKNLSGGKETVLDRTRRLLYVCCSRATKSLAVVFFVSDVEAAYTKISTSNIFQENSIIRLALPLINNKKLQGHV